MLSQFEVVSRDGELDRRSDNKVVKAMNKFNRSVHSAVPLGKVERGGNAACSVKLGMFLGPAKILDKFRPSHTKTQSTEEPIMVLANVRDDGADIAGIDEALPADQSLSFGLFHFGIIQYTCSPLLLDGNVKGRLLTVRFRTVPVDTVQNNHSWNVANVATVDSIQIQIERFDEFDFNHASCSRWN